MIRAGRGRGGRAATPAPAAGSDESAEDVSAHGNEEAVPPTDQDPPASVTAGRADQGAEQAGAAAQDAAVRTAEHESNELPPDTEAAPAGQPATSQPDSGQPPARGPFHRIERGLSRAYGHVWVRHLTLILCFEAAGIWATWPSATYLFDGKLPYNPDVASFVWNIWWVAHQLLHPGNPFFTRYMAAPVGIRLGYSTLMPLAGWLTAPITVLYGPSVSYSILTIITPGLLCYAMYRAARLWLNAPGAIVAGGFFGLSSMLAWQNWFHINIAMGSIFLPITIEAAVRFRRRPRKESAIALGVALAASLLINQESTIVALIIATAILLPWLIGKLARDRAALRRALAPLGIGAVVGLVLASPQIIAMVQQILAGGARPPQGQLAYYASQFGVPLPTMFAPSPRLDYFGLIRLTSAYGFSNPTQAGEAVPTFGVVLGGLALLGIVIGWRHRRTWAFVALWLISAVFALGTSLTFGSYCHYSVVRPGVLWGRYCRQYLPLLGHLQSTLITAPSGSPHLAPVVVSNLMPYTWLVRIPGLAGLREADRFAIAGLMGAALLAGLTVQWLSKRKATIGLIALVVALGVLEAGWSGGNRVTMPTTLPAIDHLLTHDHSNSIVVDVPFGQRGGVGATGSPSAPNALLIATHDGHPRAISYSAWVPQTTTAAISEHAFYRYLMDVETGITVSTADIRAARQDLRHLNVGWIVEWRNVWRLHHPKERYSHVNEYLRAVGFRFVQANCLVGNENAKICPSSPSQPSQAVWLYRYAPGGR